MAVWRAAGEAAGAAAGEDWSAGSGPLGARACLAAWAESAASGRPLDSAQKDRIGPKSVSLDAAAAVGEQMLERE